MGLDAEEGCAKSKSEIACEMLKLGVACGTNVALCSPQLRKWRGQRCVLMLKSVGFAIISDVKYSRVATFELCVVSFDCEETL